MPGIFNSLVSYFQYPFVRYAMIVGVLVALCSSLLGVTLVLKRFSFIGDGLSHVAFGTFSIAVVLNLSDRLILVLPVTIICAILMLRTGQHTNIKGDAALAMFSVGALAVGYLLLNRFSQSSNIAGVVCDTLFGSTSILSISKTEAWASVVLSVLVIAVFLLLYHKIFSVTFDEEFAVATGIKAKIYNLIIAIVVAVIIVLAMNLVGALLVSALVVFPALSAMRVFKSFKAVTVYSVVISVVCAALGMLTSMLADTPTGATIVAMNIIGFLLFSIAGRLKRS